MNKTAAITLIIPRGRGGVADYTDKLITNLAAEKMAVALVWHADLENDLVRSSLSSECLYLQYSGYGYAKRGAPLWLLNKLQIDRPSIKTLGVFFHELYAFGPPWGSAFWLSPAQRHIARRVVEISDFWITSREGSAQWLRRFSGKKPHAVLPVFSNVGEMQAYSSERAPKIVVFGSAGLRMATYRAVGEALFSWARDRGLELHDIGPAIDQPSISAILKRAGVIEHGRLESAEVSKILADAAFGILSYPVDYVAKSGVFAAYCAHGVCPILVSKHYAPSDRLMMGTHYLAGLPLGAIQHSMVRNIGSAAWNWYQPHRIIAHVDTLKRLLSEAGAVC
ncbi:MAG: hypothetical protein H7240_08345 [Glaciimonas sp.]|nr:hypothetical protein [Glaciimonas sp.]